MCNSPGNLHSSDLGQFLPDINSGPLTWTQKPQPTHQHSTMYCIECGQILPSVLTNSTICSKCKTPVATWWDETSKTFRTNRESILPDPSPSSKSSPSGASPFYVEEKERLRMKARVNRQSEEERVFNGALVVLEMHFQRPGTYMRETMGEAKKMVTKTLDLSLNRAEVRYVIFSALCGNGWG
jgi:palmitoyltransferase